MAFPLPLGSLTNAPRRNASSGEKSNFNGSFAHAGNKRVVPSFRRNIFQSLGDLVGISGGLSSLKTA
jgi:hypothetical protein